MAKIREEREGIGEDVPYIPVVIEKMIVGAKADGKPGVYILCIVDERDRRYELGIGIEQMNQLKASIEDVLTKYPELIR